MNRQAARSLGPALAFASVFVATNARADVFHFDQGTPAGSLTHAHVAAEACSLCHSGLIGDDGRPYGPLDLWMGSMHASAVRDPVFRSAMRIAQRDTPGIGSFCLRCHAPVAFASGHATAAAGGADGALLDPALDLEGVQCSVCHRSLDASATDPNAPYVGDGRLFWDDGTPTKPPFIHGPFDGAATTPAHRTEFDPFTASAALCGQCHEMDDPTRNEIDSAGRDTGHPLMLDTTFSEWSHSDFAGTGPNAANCVDCRMPDQPGDARAANYPGAAVREGMGRHEFVGGNVFGPALMEVMFPGLHGAAFEQTRALALANLAQAATIEITSAPSNARNGETITVTVRVVNRTGHKLPTGIADGRRMWIALDVGGVTLSGDYQNDDLVVDPQLHTYERVLGRAGSAGAETHIALQDTVLVDTRIPPQGFAPSPQTEPRGRDYGDPRAGPLRNDDVVTYRVLVPAAVQPGPIVVRARLLYQSVASNWLRALTADDPDPASARALLDGWSQAQRGAPVELARSERSIDVAPGAPLDGGLAAEPAGGSGCVAARPTRNGRSVAWFVLVSLLAITRRHARP